MPSRYDGLPCLGCGQVACDGCAGPRRLCGEEHPDFEAVFCWERPDHPRRDHVSRSGVFIWPRSRAKEGSP